MLDITRWDPFQEMMSLRDAMNRLMEESFLMPGGTSQETGQLATRGTRGGQRGPALDIVDQNDAFLVRASLPGVRPEDVNIEAQGNQVILRGQIKDEQEQDQGSYLVRERRYGQFVRVFNLPTEVNPQGAEANFENGILTLRLPKTEGARTHQIPIHAQGRQLEQGRVQGPGQVGGQPPTPGQYPGQQTPGQYPGQQPTSGQQRQGQMGTQPPTQPGQMPGQQQRQGQAGSQRQAFGKTEGEIIEEPY